MKKKHGGATSAIRINNTGRTVFNKEGAGRIVGRPKYMALIIRGHTVRLVPTDQASDSTLRMRYPKKGAPYALSTPAHFKVLGFEGGKGKPSYRVDPKPDADGGFEFRFPPEKAHHS